MHSHWLRCPHDALPIMLRLDYVELPSARKWFAAEHVARALYSRVPKGLE